jgi:hypothetical protein
MKSESSPWNLQSHQPDMLALINVKLDVLGKAALLASY